MENFVILDTFPEFLRFWKKVKDKNIKEQVELWEKDYMNEFPELFEKQKRDYKEQGIDWRKIAEKRIFPFINKNVKDIIETHELLIKILSKIYKTSVEVSKEIFDMKFSLNCVIYVGIGCGAGWVTDYEGKASILFGIENIVECGWTDEESLSGLITHEIGHVVHRILRKKNNKKWGESPYFQLYCEGFAQRFVELVFKKPFFYQAKGDDKWFEFCKNNIKFLAEKFIEHVSQGKSLNIFFGSWFNIKGHKETGYFLSTLVIRILEEEYNLKQIAVMNEKEIKEKIQVSLLSLKNYR